MQIDLSSSEETLLSSLPHTTREKIKKAGEVLTIKKFSLEHEKKDDLIVLAYAFYKDCANLHMLKIPVYREVWSELRNRKQQSMFLMAYEGNIPVATVWLSMTSTDMVYLLPGSIMRGSSLHAEYLLMWESMKEAQAQKRVTFLFSSLFPQVKSKQSELIRAFTEIQDQEPAPAFLPIPQVSRRFSVSKLLATRR
jgi:hypothetical protein